MVDRCHEDAPALVGQLPAGAALRAIPAADCGCAANVGERRDTPKGREATRKAVGSVRAGNVVHGCSSVIVRGVIASADCECSGGEEESREERREVHSGGVMCDEKLESAIQETWNARDSLEFCLFVGSCQPLLIC